MAAPALCCGVYLKLRPRREPAFRSQIRLYFSKGSQGEKRITYEVLIVLPDGAVTEDEYADHPLDGQVDSILCRPRNSSHIKFFSNTPRILNETPPTPRMLAVFARILKMTEGPIKAHEVHWYSAFADDDEEQRKIASKGLDTLVVPFPDDQTARQEFRIVDDAGNPLP